jgi:CheY-like chemotaxis protein
MFAKTTAAGPMPSDRPNSAATALCRIIDQLDEAYLDFPFGLILCDHDRGLRYAGQSFLILLGLSLQEASGLGWLERFTPSSLRSLERWRSRLKDCSDWEQELQLTDCRGSVRTLLLHAQNIKGDEPDSDMWVIVYLNITARRTALQSDKYARDFAEAVIRTLPYPVAVIHSSHRIIAANAAFYRLFNNNRTGVDGELFHQLISGHGKDLGTLLDHALITGQPFDDIQVKAKETAVDLASLLVSGRRLVVPDQNGAMILLTFAHHGTSGFTANNLDAVSPDGDGEPTRNFRVLVVDDSESDAFLLMQLLSVMGHTVAVAHDGRDALKQVEVFSPDIILTDIVMPDMDGIELARHVRSQNKSKRILLAALTGHELDSDGDVLTESDFDVHFTKPVEITKLLTLFEMISSRS